MLRSALKSIPTLPRALRCPPALLRGLSLLQGWQRLAPSPQHVGTAPSWVGGCGHGASFLTFLQQLKGENLSSKQTQRSGNESVDGPKVKRKGNRKPRRKNRMTPAQRCRRGQGLRTARRDLAPQVAAACSQKLLPQLSVCTPGTLPNAKPQLFSWVCGGTVLLLFPLAGGAAGARSAGQGSSSSPGAQVQEGSEGRGRAGKGQDTSFCSCFLPSTSPPALPVLTFVPLSPLCLL